MRGRYNNCVNIIDGDLYTKWAHARSFFGRTPPEEVFLKEKCIWESNYSHIPIEKWVEWKCKYGTYDYGQLPSTRDTKLTHGLSGVHCPYDINCSELRRSLMLVDGVNFDLLDHGDYRMRVTSQAGGPWGFECTYPGCDYYLKNNRRYLYI